MVLHFGLPFVKAVDCIPLNSYADDDVIQIKCVQVVRFRYAQSNATHFGTVRASVYLLSQRLSGTEQRKMLLLFSRSISPYKRETEGVL